MRSTVAWSLALTLGLFSALSVAARPPAHRRRARLTLPVPAAPGPDLGAQLPCAGEAPLSLVVSASFFDTHAKLVSHDLLLFQQLPIGTNQSLADLPGRPASSLSFVPPPKSDDLLAVAREYDRLLLFRGRQPTASGLGAGLAMFAAATVASAHSPYWLRFLFDRSIHLGPAVFDAGGMGAGIGGAFPR